MDEGQERPDKYCHVWEEGEMDEGWKRSDKYSIVWGGGGGQGRLLEVWLLFVSSIR